MMPGISASPSASMARAAGAERPCPIDRMRPPSTATSLTAGGLPLPSKTSAFLKSSSLTDVPLENVLRQVVVLGDAGQPCVDVSRIDGDAPAVELRRVERDFVEQPLHDRIEAPRANVLLLLVDGERDLGESPDALGLEIELDPLGREQRLILAREAGIGGGEDLLEVGYRERRELDADREASLQLRDEVRRLGEMEGAAGDEQDVIGLDHAVLGRHR